jgi:hypothetical protein
MNWQELTEAANNRPAKGAENSLDSIRPVRGGETRLPGGATMFARQLAHLGE